MKLDVALSFHLNVTVILSNDPKTRKVEVPKCRDSLY